jgi:hypothetical protein
VAAGADFIQLDEPARGNVSGEEMARLFNLATAGVKAKLAFPHLLRQPVRPLALQPFLRAVLSRPAQDARRQLVLEFAGRELSEVDLWKQYGEGASSAPASST